MKTAKLYIVPILLALISLILVLKAVQYKKEIKLNEAKAKSAAASAQTTSDASGLSQSDVLVLNNLVLALAKANGLTMSSTITEGGISFAGDPNDIHNFDGVMKFLTDIGQLPWPIKYNSVCIGKGCSKGIDLQIGFERKKG